MYKLNRGLFIIFLIKQCFKVSLYFFCVMKYVILFQKYKLRYGKIIYKKNWNFFLGTIFKFFLYQKNSLVCVIACMKKGNVNILERIALSRIDQSQIYNRSVNRDHARDTDQLHYLQTQSCTQSCDSAEIIQ